MPVYDKQFHDLGEFIRVKNISTDYIEIGINSPKISIIIPSFNQAMFIERTILSILNQKYQNTEIIIIDGGSNDGTIDIIKQYSKYIAYWVSEPDKGQADALNKGLKVVTGDYIGWQNSDDIYLPDAFKFVAKAAIGNPHIISGNAITIDENEKILSRTHFIKPSKKALLYEGMIMTSQCVFWNRKLCEGINFDISFHHAMDYAFWLKIFDIPNCKVAFCHEFLGGFRKYQGTKTVAMGNRGTEEVNKIRLSHNVNSRSIIFKIIKRFYNLRRKILFVINNIIKWN